MFPLERDSPGEGEEARDEGGVDKVEDCPGEARREPKEEPPLLGVEAAVEASDAVDPSLHERPSPSGPTGGETLCEAFCGCGRDP